MRLRLISFRMKIKYKLYSYLLMKLADFIGHRNAIGIIQIRSEDLLRQSDLEVHFLLRNLFALDIPPDVVREYTEKRLGRGR